eukprot:989630-Alexandrium_andersonii.AAC.1
MATCGTILRSGSTAKAPIVWRSRMSIRTCRPARRPKGGFLRHGEGVMQRRTERHRGPLNQ